MQEACYICKGSEGSAAVMRMASAQQDGLWQSIESADAGAYKQHVANLKVVPSKVGPVLLLCAAAATWQAAMIDIDTGCWQNATCEHVAAAAVRYVLLCMWPAQAAALGGCCKHVTCLLAKPRAKRICCYLRATLLTAGCCSCHLLCAARHRGPLPASAAAAAARAALFGRAGHVGEHVLQLAPCGGAAA
jgi:hypothetical protein